MQRASLVAQMVKNLPAKDANDSEFFQMLKRTRGSLGTYSRVPCCWLAVEQLRVHGFWSQNSQSLNACLCGLSTFPSILTLSCFLIRNAGIQIHTSEGQCED